MMHKTTFYLTIAFSLTASFLFHEAVAQTIVYPDTLWVPVIFYDYWVDNNGTNPDFEIAPASLQGFPGMVYDTLDGQRKPVPTPIACTPPTTPPTACHLSQWYRVSGVGGSDQSCIFTCDSVTNPYMQRWKWTTAAGGPLTPYGTVKGDFVGPHYDSNNTMRNVIIYDSLPFIHLGKTDPTQMGVYQYNNANFFLLDNRGFGNQPPGQNPMHNFGFTMEMHTSFTFQKGMNLTFAGDDDCWVFINGKKVVDLGGRHATLTSSISLDTMSGFTVGNKYNLDFFYAERHTTGSDIRITSNIIAAVPSKIGIKVVPNDTINSGDTATITGTVYDQFGNPVPSTLSDSITWSLDPASAKKGDTLLVKMGKTTKFTGVLTSATPRTVAVIGKYGTGNVVIDSVKITIVPGPAKSIVIYNTNQAPGTGVVPLPGPSQLITVAAGTPYLLVGNVFDRTGLWLSQYQLPPLQDSITWGAGDKNGNLNGKLDGLRGYTIHFTPTKAYDTVTIIDTLHLAGGINLMDTVRFYVVPGPEARLVIEPIGILNQLQPNPLDTLFILSNATSDSVYTTVRDAYGNFIRYGDIAAWTIFIPAIVTVANGNPAFGEGVVTRNTDTTDSITQISAVDTNSRLKDTCNVKIVKYYITALRIVIGSNTNPDSLVMNTNQDTTLIVQGKRSDNGQWIDVTATWQNSTNLKIDPSAPTNHTWTFSPSDTGTGWIRVTMNNDNVTHPDTLPVHFIPGPPVSASFVIITPAADIIAGKPIQGVVKLFDKDGNSYSYTFDSTKSGGSAAYHDALGNGGLTHEPYIMVDGDSILLDQSPWGHGNEAFINGSDTVTFTLFNAPLDTTKLHQISVKLFNGADTIRASTSPFVLHHAALGSVRIEYPNGDPVPDSVKLTDIAKFVVRGYDQYGNPLGEVIGTWSDTGGTLTLLPPPGTATDSTITVDPTSIVVDENGFINVNDGGFKDSVHITITGQPIKLVSAVTRDSSGNGLLDRMELDFSRSFALPANASFAGLTITYLDAKSHTDTLVVKRVLNTGTGIASNVWVVVLADTMNKDSLPETDWTPTVHLPAQPSLEIADNTVTAVDGAGPVVWKVVTYPAVAGDHSKDTVVVTFSETVQKSDGSQLSISDKPGDIFYVWEKDSTGSFVLEPAILAGINSLSQNPGGGTTVKFIMTNNQDLNHNYYLSIGDSAQEYLEDRSKTGSTVANVNNNPKQVNVAKVLPNISFPFNPVGPILTHEGAGVFHVANNTNAEIWVKKDHGKGAVIKISFLPPPPNATLEVIVRVYDVIGNVVISAENPDFMNGDANVSGSKYSPSDQNGQSSLTATMYWNGFNGRGMGVAAGTYRVVVYLEYKNVSAAEGKYPDQRLIGKLGIQR